ncbi:putative bifunctional diguanylate cyclase/phosphodiesterase [Kaarinaea lacus]
MPLRRSSIRTSLGFTVLVMGLLGVALAIITGEIYRHLALENQRKAFEELVHIKVDDILKDVVKKTSELGLTVQSNARFRKALAQSDAGEIQNQLNEQFHRFFVTLTIIKLQKLIAFDTHFEVTGYSSEGSDRLGPTSVPCPDLLDHARERKGATRLKIASELCMARGTPVVAVLVPIGGIRLKGYLLIAVDPTLNLSSAEKHLNMPVTIKLDSGQIVYESDNWPARDSERKFLITNYALNDTRQNPVFYLQFASDVDALYEKLGQTRLIIIAAAALATLITALLSLLLLQKTALNPISTLTQQLHRVRKDKSHLGEQVSVTGNTEITELADGFNDMAGELNVLYNTLENMAFTDSLTGLPNRAFFYERLEQFANRVRVNQTPFFLLMLDLDRFKYINDTLGHHIGDQLLQEVGHRLQHAVRSSDTIARLGGDEFAAILPSEEGKHAGTIVADKILKSLNHPIIVGQHNLSISCSIGLVHCPYDGEDINQLMQRADVAMYHAKKNRHGFTFYAPDLDRHNIIQLNLETDLYDALNNGDLELYYQPKIDLKTGTTVAVEALLRWKHKKRGNIPPEEFIPLAEHSGFIHPLTRWAIETATKQCAEWHKNKLKIGIAVNLSARSLEDSSILDTVRTALRTSGLDASYLSVELTESVVMADPHHAMEMLTKIHAMGVRIAVDDFGTGYSSLAYLKKLPVNEIKIDKSFVIDMVLDSSDEVIVHSTIDLGHNMGLNVTAEGVENEKTMEKLIILGCNLAQGHYMCEPCSAEDLSKWFFKSQWGLRANVNQVV